MWVTMRMGMGIHLDGNGHCKENYVVRGRVLSKSLGNRRMRCRVGHIRGSLFSLVCFGFSFSLAHFTAFASGVIAEPLYAPPSASTGTFHAQFGATNPPDLQHPRPSPSVITIKQEKGREVQVFSSPSQWHEYEGYWICWQCPTPNR